MGDTKSSTEPHRSLAGIILNEDDEYKTTISDGDQKATGTGYTPEIAQENASDNWKSGDTTDAGSPCYLTTACVKSKGLPDNCLELMTLRDFRDSVLMTNSAGRNAVKEYYKMAPEIVQAIDSQENAQRIWNLVYKDIKIAVSLVRSGNPNGAFKHYQEMTLNLKKTFLA